MIVEMPFAVSGNFCGKSGQTGYGQITQVGKNYLWGSCVMKSADHLELLNPIALFEAGELNKAVELLEIGAVCGKNSYQDWLTFALGKLAQGKYEETGRALNFGFALHPNLASLEPNYNYIKLLLARGQIQTGLCQWRQYLILLKACPIFDPKILWNGVSDLNDKTIAVSMNYNWGQGDQIHFGRYLKVLKMKYPRVRICLIGSQSLQRLFLANGVADSYYDSFEKVPEPVRRTVSHSADLLLLGALFARDYQRQEPIVYLKAGDDVSRELMSSLRNHPPCRAKVAFVYKGAPRPIAGRRDIDLEHFKTVFLQNPQIQFFCLQKEALDSDFAGMPNVVNLGPLLSDFYDTAFALEHMDAVVSVETSLSALTSVMGKEVHLISNIDTCYRFHTYQGQNLWFDNLTVYRHGGKPRWAEIGKQIALALRERFPVEAPAVR